MEQNFTATLLKAKPYGENAFVITVFSAEFGKVKGLVKGGKKAKANLQPMNILQVDWKRRLPSQLGNMRIECLASPTTMVFNSFLHLQALHYLAEVLDVSMAEEEPHPNLHQKTEHFLQEFSLPDKFWPQLAFYELQLLASLGYGLSLGREDAVLDKEDTSPLCWVSPKSGRAVSQTMGAPYQSRLMRLPHMFGGQKQPKKQDFVDVFALTGHFLEQALHGQRLAARSQLLALGYESGFTE